MTEPDRSAEQARDLWAEVLDEAPGSEPAEQPAGGTPAGPRVLIVDDDADFRTAIRRMLEEFGVDVVGEVAWGDLATTMAAAVEPDVVLMDYRMGGGNGIDATRSIKAAQPLTQVPMVSAFDDGEIRKEAAEVGAYGYITKGSSPSLVRERLIEAWAHKEQLRREASGPAPFAGNGPETSG